MTSVIHFQDQLHKGWICACLAGNAAFVLVQFACLLDFTNGLCQHIHARASKRRGWWKVRA